VGIGEPRTRGLVVPGRVQDQLTDQLAVFGEYADWSAGVQRRVARLYVNGQGVEVDMSKDPDRWRRKLVRPIPDTVNGGLLDPDDAPKDFLRALARDMSAGSYLVAVGPHDDELSCQVPETGTFSLSS